MREIELSGSVGLEWPTTNSLGKKRKRYMFQIYIFIIPKNVDMEEKIESL